MVRSAHWVMVIHGKMDLVVGTPAVHDSGKRFPLPQIEHREIPQEDIDVQLASACCECIQKSFKLAGNISGSLIMYKTNSAVEIPSHDDNGMMSRLSSTNKGVKVSGTVYQKSHAICRQ